MQLMTAILKKQCVITGGKKGCIKRACRAKNAKQRRVEKRNPRHKHSDTKYVREEHNVDLGMFTVHSVQDNGELDTTPYKTTFSIDEKDIAMEIDTGAARTIIPESLYQTQFRDKPLWKARVRLQTCTKQNITVKGQFKAIVCYEGQKHKLPVLVVGGNGPALCGCNWLRKIRLDWQQIKRLAFESKQEFKTVQDVLEKYADLFKDELGTLKAVKATIQVKPDARPRFFKSRPLPFAMKSQVEKELERLEETGIISPVKHSEWATPIVPVGKRDKTLRLCGDYKVTVNEVADTEIYPLPRIEELLATLSGGKVFSKVDLASAYQQVLLDEDSKKYTTINTHRGLFVYNRLPFGISSAPSFSKE